MADTLTPDGKLGCRSCPSDFRMPATHIAHPKLIDGSAGDDWPVCASHMQHAMVAGWFPIDEIKPARTIDDAPDARPDVVEAGREAYCEGYRNGFVDATVTEDGYPDEAMTLKRISNVNLTEGWEAYSDTFIAALSQPIREVEAMREHGPHCSDYLMACPQCLENFRAWKAAIAPKDGE